MNIGWSIAKDAIGAIGAIAVTIPWFRDFKGRQRLNKIRKLPVGPSLARLKRGLDEHVESWIAAPKIADLLWTVGGLLLVALSFLMGAVLTILQ